MSECRAIIETDIPARLDRLTWSWFHTWVVAALGITWILDGLGNNRRSGAVGAGPMPESGSGGRIRLAAFSRTPFIRMAMAILRNYPQRAFLGLVLMAAQAFFYNAIFFSYALVLTRFYGVPAASVGWYILPF